MEVEAVSGRRADSWQGRGRGCDHRAGGRSNGLPGGRWGRWRRDAQRGSWGAGEEAGQAEGRGRQTRLLTQGRRGSGKAGREEAYPDQPGHPGLEEGQGGRSSGGGTRREVAGELGTQRASAAERRGDPKPCQRPRAGPGRAAARRGALTGVPAHGAAGGPLPQAREEEVPGGLEVLEGAELDNRAGHGSREPRPGPHFSTAVGPTTPGTAKTTSQSHAGAGKPSRKRSRIGPPPGSKAPAQDGQRRAGEVRAL